MENLPELKALLNLPKDIVIVSHRNPDGDALGASLGLALFLQKLGHSPHVLFPSEYPSIFSWMPGIDDALIFDTDKEETLEQVRKADLIFCLDFNSLDRIDKIGEEISATNVPIVMVDHHIDPEPFAHFALSDTTASSTSELIVDLIRDLGEFRHLDAQIGSCLYTGIVTDTGSFKFSTSAKLFRTVAELLEIGVDDYALQDLIFNALPEKNLRILGHCLANRLEVLPEYHAGIIALTRRDFERFNIQRGDTEGVVNFILKMKHVQMAAFVTEQPNIVKLSLRSKGEFSVQEIASKYFKGGGHRNASGGYSYQGLRTTVNKIKDILPLYKDQLEEQARSSLHNFSAQ